jgi:hypothetical protein
MPSYLYRHPKSGKTVEIFQSVNEPHIYSENGVEFERVWTVPQASFDTNIDPFSSQAFVEKTGKPNKITVGDLWDRSAELSAKRKEKLGRDPIKEKHEKQYKADRNRK